MQVEDYSNMVANYFHGRGYEKGDSVALFMINRPEWIITWLGLVKIGVIPALINCSIRKKQLLHTTSVANCRAMIYGLELESGESCCDSRLLDLKGGCAKLQNLASTILI